MARKKIREYDSKRLLKQHLKQIAKIDLPICSAQVTESTDLTQLVNEETWLSSSKLVVKPDMLFGKRGKSGLVALNLDLAQVSEFVKERIGKEVEVGGCKAPVTTFIVEPFVPHDQEFYLSIVSDRLGCTISFSECGGIEIEENWDKVKTIFLPTEKPLTSETCAPLIATLPLEIREKIGDFIKGVFAVFQDLDFSFLEMNPFTLVNGEPYPLDMRGELDDTAAFKNFKKWGEIEFPLPFGRVLSSTENYIHTLDEKGNRQQTSEVEKEAPVQATFTHVTNRGSDDPQDGGLKLGRESDLMDLDDSNNHNQSVSSLSAVGSSEVEASQEYESDSETEYIDPWNAHTNYPTILPLRRPNSGDPDILDAAEFGEPAENLEHIEEIKSAASKIRLLNLDEIKGEPKLLFLQFPKSLPAIKQSATAKGKETEGILGPLGQKGSVAMKVGESSTADTSQETRSLEEMRAGHMGKLKVYKSGKAKLKLGETQFDVTAGSDCSFAQEVVALNTKEKEFYSIGKLDNRAIVTPDIEDILKSNENDLG